MKNSKFVFLFIVMFAISCNCDYEEKELDFISEEIALVERYNVNDTIFFENIKSKLNDTICIISLEDEKVKGSRCFIQRIPSNYKCVHFKHLNSLNHPLSSIKQFDGYFSILKKPTKDYFEFNIKFRSFATSKQSVYKYNEHDIVLNNRLFSKYTLITHGYPERIKDSSGIVLIYWTVEHGLTAYENKKGEIWVIKQ